MIYSKLVPNLPLLICLLNHQYSLLHKKWYRQEERAQVRGLRTQCMLEPFSVSAFTMHKKLYNIRFPTAGAGLLWLTKKERWYMLTCCGLYIFPNFIVLTICDSAILLVGRLKASLFIKIIVMEAWQELEKKVVVQIIPGPESNHLS